MAPRVEILVLGRGRGTQQLAKLEDKHQGRLLGGWIFTGAEGSKCGGVGLSSKWGLSLEV